MKTGALMNLNYPLQAADDAIMTSNESMSIVNKVYYNLDKIHVGYHGNVTVKF